MSTPPRRPESSDFASRHRQAETWMLRVGRGVTLAIIIFFTLSILFGKTGWVFLDNVNLVLHEAGHFVFRPFGQTMSVLGGTVHQLLWPALFAGYFWWRGHSRFAAFVCLWWLGENLQNIAVYVRDAQNMGLPLVGGEIHDWNYLLGRWGALRSCLTIGNTIRVLGWVVMTGSLFAAAWLTAFPSRRDVERSAQAPGD